MRISCNLFNKNNMSEKKSSTKPVTHTGEKHYRLCIGYWHIPRMVYLIGGFFIFGSILLAIFINEKWLYFALFVSFLFMSFALTGYCPMALFLDKLGLRRE